MSILSNYRKVIYIGLGVLLGLAVAYIAYSYFKTQELRTTVQDQKSEIESLKRTSDSLLSKLRSDEKQLIEISEKLKGPVTIVEKVKGPTEESLWNEVLSKNTFYDVLDFIRSNDNKGTYHNEALSKLMELGQTGWLYAGRSSDNATYSKDQIARVIWRKNANDIRNNSTPKMGDIITLNGTQGRRTYSNFSPRERQNGIWQSSNNAYVSELKNEGPTALIIKIIYK